MHYQAEVVGDDELPTGVDRVIVERANRDPLILIRESATPDVVRWCAEHPRSDRLRSLTWGDVGLQRKHGGL